MIVGKKNLLAWYMELPEDFIFWSMYKKGAKDSGYHCIKGLQAENTTKTDNYDKLVKALSLFDNGSYVISVQQKAGGIVKGAAAMDFEITMADAASMQNNTNANIAGFNAVGMVSEEKAQQIAEQKFEQMMVKRELDELKKKCKELEAENKEYEKTSGGVWEQIGGLVIPHIMQRFAPVVAPAMAHVGTIESAEPINPTEMELMQQKLGYVLQKTEELFGEAPVPFLEKLINTVEANPHFVGMIKGFVK